MTDAFRIGKRVKFLWRSYESAAQPIDQHTKTRVQGSGKIIDILSEGENTTLVVDTGDSHYDLPVNDSKHCYIQPLD